MDTPWRPEREIALIEARRCVRNLGLRGDEVKAVASGWDNTVVLVDREWVFRFPRREIALPGVEREIALLPHLAPHLDLAVPVPEHVGEHGDPAWPFWGARHLPGTELAVSPHADADAVAAAIGRFLAGLHALTPDRSLPDAQLPSAPLPVDPFGRADAASRARRARDVLTDLRDLGLHDHDAALDRVLTAGSECPPPPTVTVLSHGDLYARHVLVDDEGQASGVIDWGDLCMAPRSVDLSIAYSAFTGEPRRALFEAYGPIDADTELRARVMAIFSAASVAHYAHDVGDTMLLSASLSGLAGAAR